MTLAFFVLIQYWSVTDRRTDIPPLAIPEVCIACYANALVKTTEITKRLIRHITIVKINKLIRALFTRDPKK